MKTICIIGFGKIGQAIAANMIRHGCKVIAIDTDAGLIEDFAQKTYSSNEPGIQSLLTTAYDHQQLEITDSISFTDNPEAVILSIPLMVDDARKTIDAAFLECLQQLAPYCKNNLLIVVETSVPVGYCRKVLMGALELAGKKHGVDFLLAHSPERIKSGTMLQQLERVPKIIGGITQDAAERALEVYSSFFKKELLHCLDSIEAAEMLKLAGMIYRDVNIALSNQLAMFAHTAGIDFPNLLPLINTDNEANLLQPGIGVGGHCTPVYPYFLIDNFRQAGLDFSLASLGRKVNDGMAAYALSLIKDQLTKKTALILGLSFRPGVKEDSNSVGAQLYQLLSEEGFDVCLHDPEYTEDELKDKGFNAGDPDSAKVEVVFLVTMHRQYQQLDLNKMMANGVRYIVDGRNTLPGKAIEAAGIRYVGIGRG